MSHVMMRPDGDHLEKDIYGKYKTPQELKQITVGGKYEVLCKDHLNYIVDVKEYDSELCVGKLHFHGWKAAYDYKGPFNKLYITDKGTFTAGVLSDKNIYNLSSSGASSSTKRKSSGESRPSNSNSGDLVATTRYDDDYFAKPRNPPSSRRRGNVESSDKDASGAIVNLTLQEQQQQRQQSSKPKQSKSPHEENNADIDEPDEPSNNQQDTAEDAGGNEDFLFDSNELENDCHMFSADVSADVEVEGDVVAATKPTGNNNTVENNNTTDVVGGGSGAAGMGEVLGTEPDVPHISRGPMDVVVDAVSAETRESSATVASVGEADTALQCGDTVPEAVVGGLPLTSTTAVVQATAVVTAVVQTTTEIAQTVAEDTPLLASDTVIASSEPTERVSFPSSAAAKPVAPPPVKTTVTQTQISISTVDELRRHKRYTALLAQIKQDLNLIPSVEPIALGTAATITTETLVSSAQQYIVGCSKTLEAIKSPDGIAALQYYHISPEHLIAAVKARRHLDKYCREVASYADDRTKNMILVTRKNLDKLLSDLIYSFEHSTTDIVS